MEVENIEHKAFSMFFKVGEELVNDTTMDSYKDYDEYGEYGEYAVLKEGEVTVELIEPPIPANGEFSIFRNPKGQTYFLPSLKLGAGF